MVPRISENVSNSNKTIPKLGIVFKWKVYGQNFVIQEKMKVYEFMQNADLRVGSPNLHIDLLSIII